MRPVQLRFLGCGDAFGSGGRLQTCFLLEGGVAPVLLNCGTSSLIAMKQQGVDPSTIGHVLLTHLHGDHFGGVPFLILDGQFSRRELPLYVAGPPGVRQRIEATMEIFFPGSLAVKRRFPVTFIELPERQPMLLGPATVTPFLVDHACGAPPYALRVEYGGKVGTYSGDTAWTPSLIDAARGADLFICEAYFFDKPIKHHLNYQTLLKHRGHLTCKRLILTHMGPEVLARHDDVMLECADDGQVIVL